MPEISQYTPRTMLDALKQAPPVSSFLTGLFVRRSTTHDTRTVEIDIEKGGQKLAAYVSRVGEPERVAKRGFETLLHAMPYTAEQIDFTPEDLEVRNPGTTIYSAGSPSTRLNEKIAGWLQDLRGRLARLKEFQMAQALQTGKLTVAGRGVNYTVDFQMPAGNIYAVTTAWDQTGADPIADLEGAAAKIRALGAPSPTVIILGVNAAGAWLTDANVLKYMDNKNVMMGSIDPVQLADQRATFLGRFRRIGLDVAVYSYQGSYQDSTGTEQFYLDPDTVIVGSTAARVEMHYGMISNFQHGSFIGQEFPHMWLEQNGRSGHLTLESGPMVGLHQPDAFVAMTVL